jgi:hypothetical protein
MSNVLSEAKKQQVIALGRLGWPLRRIEQETGVRRETAGAYLKAAGIGGILEVLKVWKMACFCQLDLAPFDRLIWPPPYW